MKSYRPEELFNDDGSPIEELIALPPKGERRISDNPVANGGLLVVDLEVPDFRDYAVEVERPGTTQNEATRVLGSWLRRHRCRSPKLLVVRTRRSGLEPIEQCLRSHQSKVDGRDRCRRRSPQVKRSRDRGALRTPLRGTARGLSLSGRHGLFTCYEAFIHIIDSMFNQHTKWLETASRIPWRRPVASLNYLLSSHVWRQDNNGLTHQDPGFLSVVINKKPDVVHVYLPPDTDTLFLSPITASRSRQYVNVIVSGKQPALDYLTIDQAVAHCTHGIGVWDWASTETEDQEPDVVLACAGRRRTDLGIACRHGPYPPAPT